MLILPRHPVPRRQATPSSLAIFAACGTAAGLLAATVYLHYCRGRIRAGAATAPVVDELAPLSIALACSYIFVVTRSLLAPVDSAAVREALRACAPARLALAVAAGGTVIAAVRILADGPQGVTALSVFAFVSVGSIVKPLAFFVPHVVYFGPIVLLLVVYWGDFCRVTREYGLGLILVLLMTTVISMTSESRLGIFGFPMMVPLVVRVTEAISWSRGHYWILAIVAAVYSKIWLRINVAPMQGSFLEFPFQGYFMQHGPWMSNKTYAIHAVVVVATAVLLFMQLPRARRVAAPAESGA